MRHGFEWRPGAVARPDAGQRREIPGLGAGILLYAVVGGGIAVVAGALPTLDVGRAPWLTFALLGSGAALAQLFQVRTRRENAFSISVVFTVAGLFLLPLPLVVLLPIVQLAPEWLRDRYPWYRAAFNIGNHTIDLFGASMVLLAFGRPEDHQDASWVLAGLAAAAVYTLLNHSFLAAMLRATRADAGRATGLGLESLSNELVLALMGFATASFWDLNGWLVVVALAPLLLVHRSLTVELLQEEARADPKTGLLNARYFASALREELKRARRFDRPLALIMADLDLLREVNNTYGHLAGDAVLRGIAEVFREQLRHFDVPARFGGEEFAILLPETATEQALDIAERIRCEVAARSFEVETSERPIRATVSMGVAGFPADGVDANELVHHADLAVYRAKLEGRNRVVRAEPERPHEGEPWRSPLAAAFPGERP